MNVIEYGLGKHRRAEVYINRLLRYLLDPTASHGMNGDFLVAFIESLSPSIEFTEDILDPTQVRVREQVPVWETPRDERDTGDGDESPGYLDLFIDVPGEWFVLIELKFGAPQTGTEFYCEAVEFGDTSIDEYDLGTYYLYLHRSDRPQATGDCFQSWAWNEFVGDFSTPFLSDSISRYPQRTVTQLHDLRDDIKHVANMAEEQSNQDRKIALYLNHAEAVDDVKKAFKERWSQYKTDWGDRVLTNLSDLDRVTETIPASDGGHPQLIIDRTGDEEQTERWLLRATGGDWQHVTKYGWFRQSETDEILTDRDENYNDLRIGFYFRMGKDSKPQFMRRAVHDNEVAFNFRCMGANPTEFRDKFHKEFKGHRKEISSMIADTPGELTGEKRDKIEAVYSLDTTTNGFFEAYTQAVSAGVEDFIVDNKPLVTLLSEIFETSIDKWRTE